MQSTFSSSNVHGFVHDNNNPYRNIIMDMMRMSQGYAGECSIVDEQPNVDAIRFLELLKDFDDSL